MVFAREVSYDLPLMIRRQEKLTYIKLPLADISGLSSPVPWFLFYEEFMKAKWIIIGIIRILICLLMPAIMSDLIIAVIIFWG